MAKLFRVTYENAGYDELAEAVVYAGDEDDAVALVESDESLSHYYKPGYPKVERVPARRGVVSFDGNSS